MPINNFLNRHTNMGIPTDKSSTEFDDILRSLQMTGKVPANNQVADATNDRVEMEVWKSMGGTEDEWKLMQSKVEAERQRVTNEKNFQNIVSGGWVYDPFNPTARGGKPGTIQEQAWVKDFVVKNNRQPTGRELGDWTLTQDTKSANWVYAPGSALRELGFKNAAEYWAARNTPGGETYGMWAGSLVPEGSTIVLNEKGEPWYRTWDTSGVNKGYIDKYGVVPAGDTERYPTYDRTMHIRKAEEILSQPDYKIDVYKSHLSDYIDRMLETDKTKVADAKTKQQEVLDSYNNQIDDLNARITSGEITQSEGEDTAAKWESYTTGRIQFWQDIIDNAWTEDKAAQTLQEATNLIGQSADESTLPFFTESKGIIGKSMTDLMTRVAYSETEKEKKRIKDIPEFQGYPQKETQATQPTGREEANYYSWVNSLNTAKEWKYWLSQKYGDYYNAWLQSGSGMDFISWVKDFIIRGG